jgi:hypothetical protein
MSNDLWQFTIIFSGLCNAPAIFKHIMDKILQELISEIYFVYVDDIIIYKKTFEETKLGESFFRYRQVELKIYNKF